MDADITKIICNVSHHGHIGDRMVYALITVGIFDTYLVASPVFIVYKDGTDPARRRIVLKLRKGGIFVFILIQGINIFIFATLTPWNRISPPLSPTRTPSNFRNALE